MRTRTSHVELVDAPVKGRARLFASVIAGVAAAALAALMLHATAGLGGPGSDAMFSNWVYNGVIAAGAVLCLLRAASTREQRGAWLALGLGILFWSAGEIYYSIALADALEPPYPSLSDG